MNKVQRIIDMHTLVAMLIDELNDEKFSIVATDDDQCSDQTRYAIEIKDTSGMIYESLPLWKIARVVETFNQDKGYDRQFIYRVFNWKDSNKGMLLEIF